MGHRIVVVGAGYAGLPAAGRLGNRLRGSGIEVVVVNGTPDFVERPRLHQLATGRQVLTGRPAARYKELVLRSAVWLFRWPGPYLPNLS